MTVGTPCLFILQVGPAYVKIIPLLGFPQPAIALHSTHLKATGPGLEEELVVAE